MNTDFIETLRADGLISDRQATLTALTGGVSSEIYLVKDGQRQFVVKRALEQLKVQANWRADVARNVSERDYLTYVAGFNPTAVPAIVASGDGYIAMEFLGEEFKNWKREMLQGRFEAIWATKAGAFLRDIHHRSAGVAALAERFGRMDLFWQLRIDPYLVTTGQKHPELQQMFNAEAERLTTERSALVHGDFSPKNMLVHDQRLVVLDCETACYADPAFDLAFLLSHLFLKALYHRNHYSELAQLIDAFINAYEPLDQSLFQRTSRLLLMLLLARVDGKSPVEYLKDEISIGYVRAYSTLHLRERQFEFQALRQQWFEGMKTLPPRAQP